MGGIIDLIGQRFERLLIVKFIGVEKQGARWECKCDCGKTTNAIGKQLRIGNVKSCGCFKNDNIRLRSMKHGYANKTAEYRAWGHIKSRCYNPNVYNYNNYGGRGIAMCDRWLNSFENFLLDMGERPSAKHSIDRINSNGDYEPSNCKWSTTKEQSRNLRTNHWIKYDGERLILSDWANKLNATPSNLSRMIKQKSIEYAFNHYKNKLQDA